MNDFIIHWDLDPVIVWITDGVPLKYYGLFFISGLFWALGLERRIYKMEHVPVERLDQLFIYVVFGIVIGARLGHCLFYEAEYYLAHPLEMLLPIKKMGDGYVFIGYQGLASHGGTLGVLIALGLFCKNYKMHYLWVLDRIALVAPIVGAGIRLGNFMNSEIYGKPTNGNWGVVFERDDLIPRHPTQLYEALAYLLIFMVLRYLYTHKGLGKNLGATLGLALALVFTARFFLEFFKENQVGFEAEMVLNMGQWLSLPFVVIGLLLFFFGKRLSDRK
ncbi:prolipoprotein diacylglyceryl transferase [Sediminicola luteus]|uniref:Phosphatidylglycerol--prolipoprotein diacylglyceryl transferase n=1 Tax=Sediminicola luteus TaxID=319238 RepID=A0A2A4G6K7_9FLAO|nr:prolipoprotein diacylglyceryl transferase [Sediminicola luteus]PCE64071.1 prolipoprotein diacylglyceryl transferase [Sediminicola luteus]